MLQQPRAACHHSIPIHSFSHSFILIPSLNARLAASFCLVPRSSFIPLSSILIYLPVLRHKGNTFDPLLPRSLAPYSLHSTQLTAMTISGLRFDARKWFTKKKKKNTTQKNYIVSKNEFPQGTCPHSKEKGVRFHGNLYKKCKVGILRYFRYFNVYIFSYFRFFLHFFTSWNRTQRKIQKNIIRMYILSLKTIVYRYFIYFNYFFTFNLFLSREYIEKYWKRK